MHIAIYSDCDSRGGVLTYTLTLAAALRDAGANVTIVSHAPHDAFSAAILDEMTASATRVQTAPTESHTARDAERVADIVLRAKADIFIPNYRLMPYAAAALCSRRAAVKAIGICHNDHPSYYDLLQRFSGCLTRLVAASDKTAMELKARLPRRAADVATIPHGVRLAERVCRPYTGGELALIYHGRLVEEQKNISKLLEAARRLSAKQVPYRLTLIGDGSSGAACEAAAREPLLLGRVTVLGSSDWPALVMQLADSHVAVLTSDYEGFCLSLAEAMGAGVPAVAFQCGKVIEQFVVHGKTGLLVAPGDIDGLVAAIAGLQADPALWSELSNNARALITRDFSWQATVKHYLTLFEAALADPVQRRWPFGRPAWISPRGRTLPALVEKVGRKIRLWQ